MKKTGLWLTFAVIPFALGAERGAKADVAEVDVASGEPLVWVDDCPFDARQPHKIRCLSKRLLPRSEAMARRIGPFTAPPDAGGADASVDISACDGVVPSQGAGGTPTRGLAPSDYIKAYAIPSAGAGAGKIIAIVDACANTTVVSDLIAYRAQYSLPALQQCGGANGVAPTPGGAACFGVVSQRGDGALPPADDGWAGEIALDVEMASVGCPECSIVLVEADSPNSWDLGPAVDEAVALGASAISNSYGAPEDPNDPFGAAYSDGPYASYFQHDGVLITVASGDDAWDNEDLVGNAQDDPWGIEAPSFPSTVPSVLSVGGTSLKASTTAARGYTEALWKGSTSGCSTEFGTPSYQSGVAMGSCTMRGDVDVAAPATNVATYVSGSWGTVGGTSCASPFVASLFTHLGLAGQANAFFYAHPEAFFDITTGNNDPSGKCTDVMCNAGVGWDGPTGWGSPNAAVLNALLDDAGTGPTDAGGGDDSGSAVDAAGGSDSGSGADSGFDAGQATDAGSGQDATVPADAGGGDDSGPIADAGSGNDATLGQNTDASIGPDSSIVALSDASPTDDSGSVASTNEDGGANGAAPGGSSGCGCEAVGARPLSSSWSAMALAALGALAATRRRRGAAERPER